jgi:HrpA-like RNA helicase
MRDFSLPEILRVSLSNVILTLKSMRIKDVINF